MFVNRTAKRASVLIVDDEVSVINVLHEAVKDLGQVTFATDGARALELAWADAPDVILLDVEIPRMDGYAVCRSLREDPRTADCAVIFMTAHDAVRHELPALSSGAVDFLHKPLNLPVVHARVQTQLRLKQHSRQLAQARKDMADLVQLLPAFVSYWDLHACNRFSNDLAGQWFGLTADQMLGLPLRQVLRGAPVDELAGRIAAALAGERPQFELALAAVGGGTLHVQATMVGTEAEGQRNGFLLLLTDISGRKLAEQALLQEKERLRVTLESIGDSVIATDQHGRVTFINPMAEQQTGWHSKFAVGQPIETIMQLRDSATGEPMQNPIRLALNENRTVGMALNCVLVTQDGREVAVEDTASPMRDADGRLTGAIIVFHDVSEARAMAVKMTHLANHDALTDLPNRFLLYDRIDQALQHAQRAGNHVALFLLDIDQFKLVNDAVGYHVGDALLQRVAARLREQVRATDTISRQGGDEFLILLPDLDSLDGLDDKAARLLQVVQEPLLVNGEKFEITASIGISIFATDAHDRESLLRHADTAMARAKQLGRGRCQFFSRDIEERVVARHALERRIRDGLEENRFEVFYQPKVLLPERQVMGMEALIRLRDVKGQLVSPAEFIPLAEATGLIIPIGNFVLLQACCDAHAWHLAGHNCKVSVNISGVQFVDDQFPAMVRRVLQETEIRPGLLELEITEGALMHDFDRVRGIMEELVAMGIGLAIDDFGTGYSSLAYLKRFPVDVLKIDQSFVRDMMEDSSDAAIVTAIINLGRSLGIDLVAEGVETEAQAQALLAQGCRLMQGYLYSRPIPFADMSRLLERGLPAQGRPGGPA